MSYDAAITEAKTIAHTFDRVVDRSFEIFQEILASRILDQLCGTEAILDKDAGTVLDAGWLKIAIDSFFIRRAFRNAGDVELKEDVHIAADLEMIPYIPTASWQSDAFFVWLAQGRLDPFGSDREKFKFIPYGGQHVTGIVQKFFRCLRLLSSTLVLFQISKKPKVGLMELYNLVPRKKYWRLVWLTLNGRATIFENSLNDSSEPFLSLDMNRRKAIATRLEAHLATLSNHLIENTGMAHALAAYVAIALPVSHCEQRVSNSSRYGKMLHQAGSPKTVVTTVGLYFSTFNNYIGALTKHDKGQLIGIQHGGYYGYTMNLSDIEHLEMQCLDRFLSWGWSKNLTSKRPYRANIEPIGSHYLFSLQKSSKCAGNNKINDRVLLCATDFNSGALFRTENPVTSDFMISKVWPYSIESMACWLKKNSLSLDLKRYANNWVSKDGLSPYAQMTLKICAEHGVDVRLISPSIPGRQLLPSYKYVLWDSVGTGFFESNAMGCLTFLTPAARVAPIMPECIHLTDAFYVDWRTQESISLEAQFSCALAESVEFRSQFGKVASCEFLDFIESMF